MRPSLLYAATAAAFATALGSAHALETSINGFANITVGRTLSGVHETYTPPFGVTGSEVPHQYQCPCYIANWEHAGVYENNDWNFNAESSLGLQGNFTIDDKLSATLQVTARGGNSYHADIDWAYVSYEMTPKLLLQAGHKRLPIYYYSDFMYVGYSYPWVRPPSDLYGWQIYGYNGANILYRDSWGDWSLKTNVWAGESRDNDNTMMANLYYGGRVDENWKDIVGAYVDFGNEYITARAVTMRNKVDRTQYVNGAANVLLQDVGQNFYGLALNADWKNFILRSEMNQFKRPVSANVYKSYLLGGGYKLGKFTAMLTRSKFREIARDWEEVEAHNTNSASLRWDFHPSASLKLQFDKVEDESRFNLISGNRNGFSGDTKLVTISLQTVF